MICFIVNQGVFTPGGNGDFVAVSDVLFDLEEAVKIAVEVCTNTDDYSFCRHDTLDTILSCYVWEDGCIEYDTEEVLMYLQSTKFKHLLRADYEYCVYEILDKMYEKSKRSIVFEMEAFND